MAQSLISIIVSLPKKSSWILSPKSFPIPCTILRLYSWGWEDGSVHKTINCKGKDLSSNLLHACKKQQTVTTMPITPVLGGKDREILGTHWLVNLAKMLSTWFHERPCLKTIQLRAVEDDVQCLPQVLTYMCTGTYIQTLIWLHHIYTHNTTHNTHIHKVKI